MGNECGCLEEYYYDEAEIEAFRKRAEAEEERCRKWRNEQARERKQSIKDGNHYLDKAPDCNLTEFETTFDAILESRKIFKINHLHPIIMNVVEHVVGVKDTFDDRCSFCLKNKGYNFFPQHPNPRKSCYSCKCAHISMLTQKQSLQKFPKLTDEAFEDLRNQNKTQWIRRGKYYRTSDEYFLIDDIKNKCIELFGSVEGAKKQRKKKQPKKRKRDLLEMMKEMSTTPNPSEPPSKKHKAV